MAGSPLSAPRLRVAIVAGESSGDTLGAALIEALRARVPDLEVFGVAGPKMRAAGCELLADAHELSVMGLFEVLPHLPRLLRLRSRLAAQIAARAPDVFIGVDYQQFNLGLARRLKRRGFATVQYVSPQVWAWRQGRVRRMAATLDLVLCLLPFEQRFYDGAGLAAEFVGHPLADRIPLEPDQGAARARLLLPAQATVVALLPGSRRGEVERLADDFLGAADWLRERRPDLKFVAPMANAAVRGIFERALARHPGLEVRVTDGGAEAALTAADVALVASGTATLETLLCKRPMVVAYRLGGPTAALIRVFGLMKAPFFAQPNLLAGRAIVPELFQEAVTPARLGAEALGWLDDESRAAAAREEFRRIHERLRRGASERAAEAVLALIDRRRA